MPVIRVLLLVVATLLIAAGAVLGYISVVALRRSEGVFLPAGYVAAGCLVGGALILRATLRG